MTDVNQDRAAMPPASDDIDLQAGRAEDWRTVQPPTTPHNVLLHWAIFAVGFGVVMGGLVLIY
ncbi:hypothetical protein [Paracoccus sp. PAMC 22219]|uniref:hypothetical protein n=1 Tax=Paracoccus sp. PAMC 22219 TaxID=1569209 RepID=UPI0005A80A14|nr:hypothetical protein [Paracoccus sp. PAMC 22219]